MTEQTDSRPIVKATPADSGCWIEGDWGQYGNARMVDIAESYGYNNSDIVQLASTKLASLNPGTDDLTDEEDETLSGAADEVERWLNDHVAPEGYSFGWFEGEFYLWDDASWEQEYA